MCITVEEPDILEELFGCTGNWIVDVSNRYRR